MTLGKTLDIFRRTDFDCRRTSLSSDSFTGDYA